jgi:hypothetical protein
MEKKNFSLKTGYFYIFVLAAPFSWFFFYSRIFSRSVTVSHATGTIPTAAKM